MKKRFGFYFDQSEKRNEFLTREKIVSSNLKPRFKRIVFSRAFLRSSQVALSGAEPRNVRAVKPKAHSFANGSPDRDPVFVYEVYSNKRPGSMTDSDSLFYLGINHTKNPTENHGSRPVLWESTS